MVARTVAVPVFGNPFLGATFLQLRTARSRLRNCLTAVCTLHGGKSIRNVITPEESEHPLKHIVTFPVQGNPAPPVVHVTLDKNCLKNGRVIIVGDIHGCYDEFLDLLKLCKFSCKDDNLVLVGDLVNKGPKSTQVISKAQSLGALAVRGNHDDAALQRYRLWKQGNPIDDFLWVKHMKTAEEAYLQSLPFSLSIPSHRTLIVHAGLCPGVDLHKQKWVDMYKMRNIKRKGRSWMALEKASEGGTAWAAEWTGSSHVFFGHDAARRLQLHPYATGLDSGCVYGGELTACILPNMSSLQEIVGSQVTREDLGAEFVSVKAKRRYVNVK